MPNQQPQLSENSSCGTSWKNAKDKTNSTTLLARCSSKDADNFSGNGSSCSSEKDSGYSDGSDWHHTEEKQEQRTNKKQSKASEHVQAPPPGRKEQLVQSNPANVPNILPGQSLPPVYIIKDMVPQQQPSVIQKRGQSLWRNNQSSASSTPHMILFQQPRLTPDTLQLHNSSCQRLVVTAKNVNNSYIPILNSYPRIAPHPGKKPPNKSCLNSESKSLSKRVCTDLKINDAPAAQLLPEQHFHKQPKSSAGASSSSIRASQPPFASTNQGSLSVATLQATSAFLRGSGHHKDASLSTRHRRFFNTVEILRQSGLLDITFRTKELLRQSTATERGISQLRQHTELLCQAANNPSAMGWEHVHDTMDESGSYPNLRAVQNLQCPSHPDSVTQQKSLYFDTFGLRAIGTSGPPLAPAGDSVPDQNGAAFNRCASEQDGKLTGDDKRSGTVPFMPPDSSTG